MNFTVKQLADVAGVSRRTLHYYDEIGLLQPSSVGENGYRSYDEASLLRLQQILFYRELGLSLSEIGDMLSRPDFNVVQALQAHRQALRLRARRLDDLIRTIDHTIMHIQGEINMSPKQLFEAFDEETQKKYEEEAMQRWDPEVVRASNQRWRNYSDEKKAAIMQEANEFYNDILANMDKGPASPEVQNAIARWHQNIRYFYEPTPEILLGLGRMYVDDPRFAAFYENMHPDMPAFMRDAVTYYCTEGALAS
ncbi:MAG: MerR family transcriptional regulator [Caldilineales bacterium]|nr:MerR family transcriptional regulator [Caldilineales bacterium]